MATKPRSTIEILRSDDATADELDGLNRELQTRWRYDSRLQAPIQPVWLRIEDIQYLPELQVRRDYKDRNQPAARNGALMQAVIEGETGTPGDPFAIEPLRVIGQSAEDDKMLYWIADGWKRTDAYKRAQSRYVPCAIFPPMDGKTAQTSAYYIGALGNATHGDQMSEKDKQAAVLRMLELKFSHEEIRRALGYSRAQTYNIELEARGKRVLAGQGVPNDVLEKLPASTVQKIMRQVITKPSYILPDEEAAKRDETLRYQAAVNLARANQAGPSLDKLLANSKDDPEWPERMAIPENVTVRSTGGGTPKPPVSGDEAAKGSDSVDERPTGAAAKNETQQSLRPTGDEKIPAPAAADRYAHWARTLVSYAHDPSVGIGDLLEETAKAMNIQTLESILQGLTKVRQAIILAEKKAAEKAAAEDAEKAAKEAK